MTKPVRKLAIVGASARSAAFSAIRAGYDVTTADLFADADLARVCPATRISGYPEALADWLATAECDAWLYTGALECHLGLVNRMAEIRPLAGNNGRALREVRDPFVLQDALRDAGLAFPNTVKSADGLPLDGSWLCKTYRSAGGAGVWSLDSAAARDRALNAGAIFQRRIDGDCWHAAAIFALGENRSHLLGLTQQWVGDPRTGAKPWQYAGSVGPAPLDGQLHERLVRLRDRLARQFRLRGLVGVDLVVEGEQAWVVEVNPRYTASTEIVERMTGVSAIAAHLAAFGKAEWDARIPPAPMHYAESPLRTYGKAIVFAKQDVTIADRFHEWAMEQASVDFDKQLAADIPHAREAIAAGHPVLTVFAEGPSLGCQEQLRERIAEVESRLYH